MPPHTLKSAVASLRQRTARQAIHLWQRPTTAVARALLREYAGSGWVVAEAAALAAFFLFAFHTPDGPAHFFEAAYVGLGTTAVLGGVAISAWALQPGVYTPFAQRYGLGACARGLALALAAVQLSWYLFLLVLALLTGSLVGASFGGMVAGSLGLLANVTLLALVAGVLGPPLASSRERIGFLIWLAAALYSYMDHSFLAMLCSVARLPLLPAGALFASGVSGRLGWGGMLALLLVVGYTVVLVGLLAWRLETRAIPTPKGDPAAEH